VNAQQLRWQQEGASAAGEAASAQQMPSLTQQRQRQHSHSSHLAAVWHTHKVLQSAAVEAAVTGVRG